MRRVLGLLAAVGLLAATFPAAALAGEPTKASGTQTALMCEVSTDAGFIGLTIQAYGDDATGFFALWGPGTVPFEDLPTIMNGEGTVTIEGSGVRAAFDLVTVADERLAGSVTLGVQLSPSGPPIVSSNDGSDGNIRYRTEQVTQLLTATGTLILDLFDGTHVEVELTTCGASTNSSTYFATNPNAWVYGGEQLFLTCEWVTDDGPISLFAFSDETQDLSQLVVIRGDRVLLGTVGHSFTATRYEATFGLSDLSSGEMVGGATAFAALAPSGERITDNVRIGEHRLRTTGERLAVSGMLSLDVDGRAMSIPMDDGSCRAGDVRVQGQQAMGG